MAKCECCGNRTGIISFTITDINGNVHDVCKKCFTEAKQKGEQLHYNSELGKVMIGGAQEEIRKKCNVCGHVFCYNAADLARNQANAQQARLSAIAGTANALNGSVTASAVQTHNAATVMNQIIDFNKCPHCGSTDIVKLSADEYEAELKKKEGAAATLSAADEIKKFKELLDLGIISQEEFDAKKRQLLGL